MLLNGVLMVVNPEEDLVLLVMLLVLVEEDLYVSLLLTLNLVDNLYSVLVQAAEEDIKSVEPVAVKLVEKVEDPVELVVLKLVWGGIIVLVLTLVLNILVVMVMQEVLNNLVHMMVLVEELVTSVAKEVVLMPEVVVEDLVIVTLHTCLIVFLLKVIKV